MRLLLAAVAAMIASASAAAPITMRCPGHYWMPEHKIMGDSVIASLIIDLDNLSVGGSLGDYKIIETSDARIRFSAPSSDEKKFGRFFGSVDRITGVTTINSILDDGTVPIIYNLNCLPAVPLL